jgi:fatty-acyl-CoA synthase
MRAFAATLNEALLARSTDARRGFSFVRSDGTETFFTFARIAEEARRRASALASRGLAKGDRVVLIVPEPEDFVLAFLGAVVGGFVPVPMFPPFAARDLSVFESGVEHVVRASGAKLRVTTAALDRTLSPHTKAGAPAVLTTEDLVAHDGFADIHAAHPDDLAFLQFTSGSTARPKGVMVSHGNLAANSRAFMLEGLRSDPDADTGVSWLPLFHDMGLIGFVIGPIFASVSVTFLPTASFVRRPLLWLETIAKKKASITYAPNFAYELVAKRLKAGDVESLDLSSLKHAGCGAEPISRSRCARSPRSSRRRSSPRRPSCRRTAWQRRRSR